MLSFNYCNYFCLKLTGSSIHSTSHIKLSLCFLPPLLLSLYHMNRTIATIIYESILPYLSFAGGYYQRYFQPAVRLTRFDFVVCALAELDYAVEGFSAHIFHQRKVFFYEEIS